MRTIGLCIIVLVIPFILLVNTFNFSSKQIITNMVKPLNLDKENTIKRLSKALSFETISNQDLNKINKNEFLNFHKYLEIGFPRIHSNLKKEIINNYSVLYTWKGQNSSLKPILLTAHQDVVPVDPHSKVNWKYPPFSGKISNGYVWGRGALDNKSGVMGIMEAVEALLTNGFQPERTVYIAFGHDEEIGGKAGASKISEFMSSRNIKVEFMLDEGLVVTEGVLPISDPVALVGIAEKGYLSLELSLTSNGGHSSMPPKSTSIGILSRSIQKIENTPLPAGINGVLAQTFNYLGPEMPYIKKLTFANLWLFNSIVESQLSESKAINASLRTTSAITMFQSGIKENVLPTEAKVVINFRIIPGESVSQIIDHVKNIINNPNIKIKIHGKSTNEPSKISPITSSGFQLIQQSIAEVFPKIVVAPGLMLGSTDSRHYARLTDNIYRFSPIHFTSEDLSRIHGTNERISIENYMNTIKFYTQLIKNSTQNN